MIVGLSHGNRCSRGAAPGTRSRGSARSPERTSGPLVSSMIATQPRPNALYSFTRSTTCGGALEGFTV